MSETELHHRFVRLVGERIDDGEYRLNGLPRHADFRKAEEYVELEAGWLKVEGVGFAAESFEFSEHGTDVIVEQQAPGGSAHISFEEFSEE